MDFRTEIAFLYLAGFIATAWALIAAYLKTQGQLETRKRLYARHLKLNENRASEDRPRAYYADVSAWKAAQDDLNSKYTAIRIAEGVNLNTFESVDLTGQQGAIELVQESVAAIRFNLLWAGGGILISTVASIWAIWPIVT
jgi:hypothetical protein